MDSSRHKADKTPSAEAMYDAFSEDYDRFVDWDGRLAAEIPFIVRQLRSADAQRVLDVACGTGMHAVALARRGYKVVGVDSSVRMIERAHANAADAGIEVTFDVAAFGGVVETLAAEDICPTFDAVLCLGNSLPHLLTADQLDRGLGDLAACLTPGGLLLVQNRNFDAVLSKHDRWIDPQGHQRGDDEWLFVRFYDFEPSGLLTFNVVTLHRERDNPWAQRLTSTKLWPLTRQDLVPALERAGLGTVTLYGTMGGAEWDVETSPNLVATALKSW